MHEVNEAHAPTQRGVFCSWGSNMHHTGVSLSMDGWISDTLTVSGVDLHPWDIPPTPTPTITTHTQAHVWASSFCSNTPRDPRDGSYLRATFWVCVCVCVLLPCVGSWFSQKRWITSSRLMSSGEKTTLTTSVWPVRPNGERQTGINQNLSCLHSL